MKNTLLVLSVLACVMTVGIGARFCLTLSRVAPEATAPVKKKEYSKLIAEGVRYRDFETLGVERIFSAERADSDLRSKGLKLRACTVFSAGGTERRVTSALWVPEPSPTLIFREGGTEQRIPCE